MASNVALDKSCDTSRSNSLTSTQSLDKEKERGKEKEKGKLDDDNGMDTDYSDFGRTARMSLRRATSKLGSLSPRGNKDRPTRRLSKSIPRNRNFHSPDPEVWHPEEGEQRSRDIDRYLLYESSRLERQFKLLLLGPSGAKDLFWKQARLVYEPAKDAERKDLKLEVRKTVAKTANSYFRELSDQVTQMMKKESKDDPSTATLYLKKSLDLEVTSKDRGTVQEAIQLLRDPVFYNAMADVGLPWKTIERQTLRSTHFPPSPCYCETPSSILGQLERVFAPGFEPVAHDNLHFDHRGPASLREVQIQRSTHLLRLIELGNARNERKKWIHFFEDNQCIVGVADLMDYDNYLMDNDMDSCMREALVLFDSIAKGGKYFRSVPMLIVLVNVAAFKQRLQKVPLSKLFPEYKGNTDQEAVDFVVEKFRKTCERPAGIHIRLADSISPQAVSDTMGYIETKVLKDSLAKFKNMARRHGKSASA